MLYRMPQATRPPLFEACGCICRHGERVLLLERRRDKSYPRHWGIPSGKLRKGETPEQATIRELYEETSLLLSAHNLTKVGEYHIVNPDMSFLYHLYLVDFQSSPNIQIGREHRAEGWFHPHEVIHLDLIPDLAECFLEAGIRLPGFESQLDLFPEILENPERVSPALLEDEVTHEIGDIRRFVGRAAKPFCISYGPPGAGKTSALQAMHSLNPTIPFIKDTRPLQKGSRLSFYLHRIFEGGDKAFLFRFQSEALVHRFLLTLEAPEGCLLDESIYSNHAYARALQDLGWITTYEFQTLSLQYHIYDQMLPWPLNIQYYKAPPEVLLKRIPNRNRYHEQFYTKDYVTALHRQFDELAERLAAKQNVTEIPTETDSVDEIARSYGPPSRS